MSTALVDVIEEVLIVETGETIVEILEVGIEGLSGARGSVWHSGNGVPLAGLGAVDDFYLDRLNSDVYKKLSSGWEFQINLSAGGIVQWANIQGKPTEFPPEPHTHVAAEITDFSSATNNALTIIDGGNF